MAGWIIFIKERIPLPVYALLAGGLAGSGVALQQEWATTPFVVSFIGLLLFFVELRLMDEYKDFEKDQVAHPERPLPRGIVSKAQVLAKIHWSVGAMLVYALINFLIVDTMAGVFYLIITGYLWLMYKEFYAGPWLSSKPALYALSHQLILIPCCYYTVAVIPSFFEWQPEILWYALLVLGTFFTYEICRKLDPASHPVLMTYLHCYGRFKTWLMIVLTSAISAMGAAGSGLGLILWPLHSLVLLVGLLLFLVPGKYKVIEVFASLSLIIHFWVLPAQFVLTL